MDVDPDKLSSFMGKMLGEFGAALNASLVMIGDKLGLYKNAGGTRTNELR